MNPELFIGMISGTSRDGADVVLVRFEHDRPEILAADCIPYAPALARALQKLIETGTRPPAEDMKHLDRLLADHFARSAQSLLNRNGIDAGVVSAIGSHGQTVWHDPDSAEPETIQLGDPARIAAQTGITTVGDFRRADMEAGGQGAPLAPLLHHALFQQAPESGQTTRIVINLGGIANISVIESSGSISGFDTGPANCLMDGWIQARCKEPFDRGGRWAASGHASADLLECLLADPYFTKQPPKSTGVEYFNSAWLDSRLRQSDIDPADVQATLAELTAVSLANSILPFTPGDVLVCGGGTHNEYLLQRLQAHLPDIPVASTTFLGLDPDWIEGILFAWLARERLAHRLQHTWSITGAKEPVLLGKIFRHG